MARAHRGPPRRNGGPHSSFARPRRHGAALGEGARRRHLGCRPARRPREARWWLAALDDTQRGHGTLTNMPQRGNNMEGVTVVDHPLVAHKLTLMRDKRRSTK